MPEPDYLIDRPPYYISERREGDWLIRETHAANWMQFQVGKNTYELRRYRHKDFSGDGLFFENVTLFHLHGYGHTEHEAMRMALER